MNNDYNYYYYTMLKCCKTINKTLNSLRNQTSMNFECITDGWNSIDGTQKIIIKNMTS